LSGSCSPTFTGVAYVDLPPGINVQPSIEHAG